MRAIVLVFSGICFRVAFWLGLALTGYLLVCGHLFNDESFCMLICENCCILEGASWLLIDALTECYYCLKGLLFCYMNFGKCFVLGRPSWSLVMALTRDLLLGGLVQGFYYVWLAGSAMYLKSYFKLKMSFELQGRRNIQQSKSCKPIELWCMSWSHKKLLSSVEVGKLS